MTDVADVTPPDQTVWWNGPAIAAAVMDVLRLDTGDVDEARVAELVIVGGQRINDYLDRPDTDPVVTPAPLVLDEALIQVTLELYRAKDAPPSSVDGLLAASWRPPSIDPLTGVRNMLRPYKRRFGIG